MTHDNSNLPPGTTQDDDHFNELGAKWYKTCTKCNGIRNRYVACETCNGTGVEKREPEEVYEEEIAKQENQHQHDL